MFSAVGLGRKHRLQERPCVLDCDARRRFLLRFADEVTPMVRQMVRLQDVVKLPLSS